MLLEYWREKGDKQVAWQVDYASLLIANADAWPPFEQPINSPCVLKLPTLIGYSKLGPMGLSHRSKTKGWYFLWYLKRHPNSLVYPIHLLSGNINPPLHLRQQKRGLFDARFICQSMQQINSDLISTQISLLTDLIGLVVILTLVELRRWPFDMPK